MAHEAAAAEPTIASQAHEISERRARNMHLLATDLMHTGQVRSDLTVEDIADTIWSMNAPELTALLLEDRGWTPDRLAAWLTDSWQRLLLAESASPH